MNNKYFIQGLLYGLSFAESLSKSRDFSVWAQQVMIFFKDGSKLTFAINRGISHTYGNFTAMLTQDQECNLFDIASNWVKIDQLQVIEKLGYGFEYGEIRVTLDQLVSIIDALGEINYELSQKEWLKIYLDKYHK